MVLVTSQLGEATSIQAEDLDDLDLDRLVGLALRKTGSMSA